MQGPAFVSLAAVCLAIVEVIVEIVVVIVVLVVVVVAGVGVVIVVVVLAEVGVVVIFGASGMSKRFIVAVIEVLRHIYDCFVSWLFVL